VDDIGDYGLETVRDIVSMLAWTRSRQIILLPEDVAEAVRDGYCELELAITELRDMLADLERDPSPSRRPIVGIS
jgi:hypothetical protein